MIDKSTSEAANYRILSSLDSSRPNNSSCLHLKPPSCFHSEYLIHRRRHFFTSLGKHDKDTIPSNLRHKNFSFPALASHNFNIYSQVPLTATFLLLKLYSCICKLGLLHRSGFPHAFHLITDVIKFPPSLIWVNLISCKEVRFDDQKYISINLYVFVKH